MTVSNNIPAGTTQRAMDLVDSIKSGGITVTEAARVLATAKNDVDRSQIGVALAYFDFTDFKGARAAEALIKDQTALQVLGSNLGPAGADGVMGPKTKAAVIAFQQSHGLSPSGVVDDATRAKLQSSVKEAAAPLRAQATTEATQLKGALLSQFAHTRPPLTKESIDSYAHRSRDDIAFAESKGLIPQGSGKLLAALSDRLRLIEAPDDKLASAVVRYKTLAEVGGFGMAGLLKPS